MHSFDFKKLNNEETIEYNHIASEVSNDYNNIIERLTNNLNNFYWQFSTIPSRNKYYSNIFQQLLIIKYSLFILNKNVYNYIILL